VPRLPFVDTHVHYWDLREPALRYSWLDRDALHPHFGDIDGLKAIRYSAAEFAVETRFQHVTKAVHVQAAIGTADPVEETRWLQGQAERFGYPHGIVAHCDLASPGAEASLERHLAYANLRGIRDLAQGDYLSDPAWRRGLGLLAERDLVYCLDVVWEDMAKARAAADEHPDVVISVDHAGFPRARDREYFGSWKRGLATVAGASNAVIKISGLGMYDPAWTTDSIRPWVLACIEAFGVERSFFGTNWPIDRLFSAYGDILEAYAAIIAEFTLDEQTALFSGNAERIFRL
jgi:predicted TIM-barrel fold metal-dependent hydrolase